MKVLSLAFAAIAALFVGLSAPAHANWKSNILNPNTSAPVTVAPRASYRERSSSRVRRSARKSAGRSARRSASRSSTRAAARRSRVAAPRRRSGNRTRYARRGGSLSGLASYYWQPQRVAAGGWFNPNALTAAHKTLPFGTRVKVTNLRNGRSVVVRINDRGPYIRGRIIDLSKRAAGVVGMTSSGVVPVRVDIL